VKRNVKAVLFDFDGTLTVPGLIDFLAIKKAINCPRDIPILEFIAGLSSAAERSSAARVLEKYEDEASRSAKPNDDAEGIILFLRKKGFKTGIITRNRLASVRASLDNFKKVGEKDFDLVVTRENVEKIKPHPEGVLFAARSFGIQAGELAVVGDYVFDIEAGRKAGALTVFLESAHTTKRPDPPADWTINGLDELMGIFGHE